jgi:hypothetical protein
MAAVARIGQIRNSADLQLRAHDLEQEKHLSLALHSGTARGGTRSDVCASEERIAIRSRSRGGYGSHARLS